LIEDDAPAHEAAVAGFNRDKMEAHKLKLQGEEHKKAMAALNARKVRSSHLLPSFAISS